MARINVEYDVESRPEFRKLRRLLGNDDDRAMGMLIRFWRLAQKYWAEGRLVPLEEIENWELEPIIESKWGVVREGGVYAKGSEEKFAWYLQKCQAGKKGRRRLSQKENLEKPGNHSLIETSADGIFVNRNGVSEVSQTNSENPLSLAPSPVLSPTPNKNKETKGANTLAPLPRSNGKLNNNLDTSRFIATYVKAYQVRYSEKTRPDLRGKVQGQIKSLLNEIPTDRACELIQVYCQMDEPWFVKKHHDFGTFLENLNKVACALDTGQEGNSVDWAKVFSGAGGVE